MIVQGSSDMCGFSRKIPKGTHLHSSTGLPGTSQVATLGLCFRVLLLTLPPALLPAVHASPPPPPPPYSSPLSDSSAFEEPVFTKGLGSYCLTVCFSPSVVPSPLTAFPFAPLFEKSFDYSSCFFSSLCQLTHGQPSRHLWVSLSRGQPASVLSYQNPLPQALQPPCFHVSSSLNQ